MSTDTTGTPIPPGYKLWYLTETPGGTVVPTDLHRVAEDRVARCGHQARGTLVAQDYAEAFKLGMDREGGSNVQ